VAPVTLLTTNGRAGSNDDGGELEAWLTLLACCRSRSPAGDGRLAVIIRNNVEPGASFITLFKMPGAEACRSDRRVENWSGYGRESGGGFASFTTAIEASFDARDERIGARRDH